MIAGVGHIDRYLSEDEVSALVKEAVSRCELDGKRIIVIIPDATRTAPIAMMFRIFGELLGDRVEALDYLIALGTHQPMSEEMITELVGVGPVERATKYPRSKVFNHYWNDPETFVELGRIPEEEIVSISDGLLKESVRVIVNRLIFDYDQIIICGPTFPHEVVGFSGGNKYFFPGISGADVINFSHWLGALITSYSLIGQKHTPVRRVIDRAAAMIDRPKLCFSMVVKGESLAGLYIGSPEEAWEAASDLSAQLHIVWVDRPYKRVLSVMPKLYDDIWTGAKGMYKLEPAIADGGEVVIYAPHIDEFSYTHGQVLEQVGYHTRDYFIKQWDRFKDFPLGVIAHSTHLKGIGTYDEATGTEYPRIRVTLATRISRERCERLNLGYLDPDTINIDEWKNREDEGILLVPKAGEMLYRIKPEQSR